jgi:hypothetical protein
MVQLTILKELQWNRQRNIYYSVKSFRQNYSVIQVTNMSNEEQLYIHDLVPTVNIDYLKLASFGLIYTCCHDIDIHTFWLFVNHHWFPLWYLHISRVRFGHTFLIYTPYTISLLRFNGYQLG